VTAPRQFGPYRAYGVAIASTVRLPELPTRPAADVRISVTQAADADQRQPPGSAEDAEVELYRTADGCHLRFPGTADFRFSAGCGEIEVVPKRGLPANTLRHLLIDHAILWALSCLGDLILHASGVAFPEGAALFLGPSGAGKSTIATAFARRGLPVLCDDGARIVGDGPQLAVAPSYPGIRLWPDGVEAVLEVDEPLLAIAHNSAKQRWVPGAIPERPVPLACVFFLDDVDAAPEVTALSHREALVRILDQSYQVPGAPSEDVRNHLDRLAGFVAARPMFRLQRPYDFSRLDDVASVVRHTMGRLGHRTLDSTSPAETSEIDVSS